DDPEEQTAGLQKLDALLWADAYGVPLFAHPTLTAVSERIEGVSRSPLARGVLWNACAWTPAAATPRPADCRASACRARLRADATPPERWRRIPPPPPQIHA